MAGSKERVKIAMSGGRPDRVPVIPQICPPHAIRVAGMPYKETIVDRLEHPEKYDLIEPDCAASYGVDGFRVWLGAEPQKIEWDGEAAYAVDPGNGERLGVVDFNGGGGILNLPEKRRQLAEKDIEAIEVVPAGDLTESIAMRPHRKAIEKYGSKYFIIGAPGSFTIESMCHVQGMEPTLMDMLDRPEFIRQWTERQLQASIQRAIAMAKLGVDAFYIGETFGQFMSAEIFEMLCLPYFQRFVKEVRPHGPLIYLHMCGRVTHLLELMAATGVDCIEPLDEVAGTRVAEVAKRIGDRVALMGGVSTVILARGSVEAVRQECRRCIREAGKNGGYILAACDMLPTETEPEKVQAMIDIACQEGNYRS